MERMENKEINVGEYYYESKQKENQADTEIGVLKDS